MDAGDVVDLVLGVWAEPCRSWVLERFTIGWVEGVFGLEALPCLFGSRPRIRVTACSGEPPGWCRGGFCACQGGEPYEERRLCPVRCLETSSGYILVEEV